MKRIYQLLILTVSLTVLSVWTFRINQASLFGMNFRGGNALNLLEEFHNYGLSKSTMTIVGIFKVTAAILLIVGLRFKKFVVPAATLMAVFMCAAIYFHLKISDPVLPTAPSTLMLLSCIAIISLSKRGDIV